MSPQILIAGIGNIFFGDDGFGCEVACRLSLEALPASVKVVDYGIRGLDLAYALLEPYDAVIFVDAIARDNVPGTIYVLEPSGDAQTDVSLDPHSMDPLHVMAMARSLGEITARLFIVGCQPQDFGDELEGRMGLSPAVAGSVAQAVRAVLDLTASLSAGQMIVVARSELNHSHLRQGDRP